MNSLFIECEILHRTTIEYYFIHSILILLFLLDYFIIVSICLDMALPLFCVFYFHLSFIYL